ncbi:MAG: hypothetical protein A3I75_08015 [Deltaproteobacteria bacterium RIFCSPLOWO2_02_FULL_50_16]|nr:MAG: hypothetical protein A2053_03610 [Deltaproteobacteria bacterium GWA2_50_8]OGQ56003.1 MAG: hypothetical protein A3I75_08015 [Deltaproteobacteria bacterium RIFCSPLOWO2_02_FULL_50_16]OGQ69131.1 MAG: hypothetical protein A3F89_07925 [Deltaproteobacteria bacterium RIFCSPLOWO2_12_FULL_50_11]
MEILTATYLLPIEGDPIPQGAIVIDEDHILDLGVQSDILPRYCSAKVTDYPQAVIMPGLVNAHAHLDRSTAPSIQPDTSYISWLAEWIRVREDISAVMRRESILNGLYESLHHGTTCIGDMGNHTGALEPLLQSKMRLKIFPEFVGSTRENAPSQFESTLKILDDISNKNSNRLSAGVAPYSSYMLSKEMLSILARHAAYHQIPLKIHMAESFTEMEFFYEAKGEITETLFPSMGWEDAEIPLYRNTPLQYIHKIGLMKNAPILVGCLHLSNQDLELIKKTSSKIVHCPRNNEFFHLGTPPLKKWLEAGIPIGLGTEGRDVSSSLSLWDEMRSVVKTHAHNGRSPTPQEILSIATWGGARTLGLDREIGSLARGKKADLIAVSLPEGTDTPQIFSSLIQETTQEDIKTVVVDGQTLL